MSCTEQSYCKQHGGGDYAFYGCESLASVEIPSTLTAVGSYVFGACHELNELTMQDGVTGIGYGMFAGCDNLKDEARITEKQLIVRITLR